MSWSNVLPWWSTRQKSKNNKLLCLARFPMNCVQGVLEASLITWLISVAAFMCSSWICDFTFIPD